MSFDALAQSSFATAWVLILGACIGSFLNVVIYRLPRGFHLSMPSRSACPKCRRRLKSYENIPILSYMLQLGQCRSCGTKISPRYPIVELITASLFLAVYRHYGISWVTPFYFWFVAALIAITFIDLDHRIIPDVISFPGVAIGLIASLISPELSFVSGILGALFGGGVFWLLGFLYEKYSGREGLGFGDIKLLAMIGAFHGPMGVFGTILVSSVLGSVVGLILVFAQRKSIKTAIPFGPFLAIGALMFLFWGDYLAVRLYPDF